ncbi:MAG: hypothetical protein J6V21_07565, partial [Alistipes sp.]|nr:hypothetical protein [Alistipes sp.]
AFYFYSEPFTVSNGMAPIAAELRRPFAQLNIGTNDYDESTSAGYTVTKAKVTTYAYKTLHFDTGVVEGKDMVHFDYAAIPTAQAFPVSGYEYMAMNYLLIANTKETIDVVFTYSDGAVEKQRTVGSVPVQRNYRTNLYGQLLTSDLAANVEIKPEYAGAHNGVIEVSTADMFTAAFANAEVDFIVLNNDINLTASAARTTPTLTVSAGESVTIKMNGHRITAATPQLFDVAGELVVENGTIENTAGQVFAANANVKASNATILQDTDSAYYDEQGGKLELLAEGVVKVSEDNYAITAACGLAWFANNVAACNGKTIELYSDITLPDGFHPIGYNPTNGNVTTYEGTFDGNGHTIYNLKQQNLGGAYKQSVGLFAKVHNTTIKNLVVEDFSASIYGAEAGVVVTWATGDCTFEGITVKNGDVVACNCETGGVVGWAESGNFTFKDITVGSDVTVSSLWNSPDTPVGGVIGGVGNSNGYTMSVTLENINVACQLDVYNDVSANYQWSAYRRAGMLIGNIRKTQTIDGTTYPDPVAEGVTCKNVTVTYDTWMNYHYCEFKSNGHGSYDDEFTWKCTRVEGSDWGTDTLDTSKCQHEWFESHKMCLTVDQLFGGGQGVYGLPAYEGVTVNYPAEYTCPLCGQQHNVK